MESDNLKTASLYINNQLLSRGLLRNGQTLEFARPDNGDGGMEATMGRIMSVVNDLILRRDRDATQRENLSQTIRALRADGLRQTTEFERVNTKLVEAQRKVGLAEANDRALKQQIKSAEQAARALKEEMAKMKMLVNSTRASCANEVRKRERVIEGMKKHVGEGGRARGSGKAVGVMSINVVAGVGEERKNEGGSVGVDDTGYELRMETNEFLTELARGLSEENESMGGLLRRTVETLRSLSGCEKEEGEEGMVVHMETGYESLAGEMDFVIEHLRHLLTNPSFVPLEEVEVREEEIIRLREGWEKMESRWREAVEMMEGWRKRLARSGQTVNLEELKMGLMLSPLRPQGRQDPGQGFQLSTLMEEGEGDTQADIDAMDDSGIPEHDMQEPEFDEDDDMSESSLFEEEPLEEEPLDEEQSEEVTEEQPDHDNTYATESSLSPGPPPQLSPLRETNARVNQGTPSPQREGFSTIEEENTFDLLQLDASSPAKTKPKSVKSTPQPPPKNDNIVPSSPDILCVTQKSSNVSQRSPRKTSNPTPKSSRAAVPKLQQTPSSRLPRPRDNPPPQQSPLTMATIAAKLAATEREADAARVRAKLKAAKLNRSKPTTTEATKLMPPPEKPRDLDDVEGEGEPVKADESRKRKAGRTQGGRANRRRSTLSPWELESLITGGVKE